VGLGAGLNTEVRGKSFTCALVLSVAIKVFWTGDWKRSIKASMDEPKTASYSDFEL
jgi:hypothetical protein